MAASDGNLRESNQTTDRALELLNLFEEHEELGISEIAEIMQLKKTNVTRLVASLQKYDFIRQNPETRKYRLGYRLLLLGDIVQERSELGKMMLSDMQQIAEYFRISVTMMVQEQDHMRIVQKVDAGTVINISARKGSVVPIYITASGKLALSYCSKEYIDHYLETVRLVPCTKHTITDPNAMREELALIRKRGYSLDNEESVPGLTCISVPLKGRTGRLFATLSINSQTYLMKENKDEYLKKLLSAAEKFALEH